MARGLDDDLNRFYGLGHTPRTDLALEHSFGTKHVGKKTYVSCHESHPALVIPGTTLKIYGGSCLHPAVADADVYIGFDASMKQTPRSWPWKEGEEFLFEIRDMDAPSNAQEFVKLVNWTAKQLQGGKKVHCGCIGGHGRTGTFLSALVCTMAGEKDAISYVREHYCDKAVESQTQVKFLADVFGILPAQGSKTGNIKLVNSKKPVEKTKYEPETPTYHSQHITYLKDFSIWD